MRKRHAAISAGEPQPSLTRVEPAPTLAAPHTDDCTRVRSERGKGVIDETYAARVGSACLHVANCPYLWFKQKTAGEVLPRVVIHGE